MRPYGGPSRDARRLSRESPRGAAATAAVPAAARSRRRRGAGDTAAARSAAGAGAGFLTMSSRKGAAALTQLVAAGQVQAARAQHDVGRGRPRRAWGGQRRRGISAKRRRGGRARRSARLERDGACELLAPASLSAVHGSCSAAADGHASGTEAAVAAMDAAAARTARGSPSVMRTEAQRTVAAR